MVRAIFLLALLLPSLSLSASNFPRPASLEPAIQFWIKVYTQVSTNQGYVHDDETLSVIYEVIDLPPTASREVRNQQIDAAIKRVRGALHSLGQGKRSGLNATEKAVLASWPEGTTSRTFAQAAENVRFQTGQSDRFKEGLVRSGQWKPHIRAVLAKYELPQELEVLPHVESSFNPFAYSKVAAAGMWQFMPATAREYMRVDQVIDERMDPFISSDGAARLLKTNFRVTGTWPLALTGYNHGAGGISRAAKALGTTDIDVIVRNYKGPAFGFASRNFYASFLAALEIDRNPGRYVGQVQLDEPTDYDVVTVQEYVSAQALAREAGISIEELKMHNPALLAPVWQGEKYIPQNYPIRVPAAQLRQSLDRTVASLSGGGRFSQQKPDRTHRIAQGDSLSTIARRYGVSVSSLMSVNGLRNHSIQAGKTLLLPGNLGREPLSAEQIAVTRARLTGGQPTEYTIRSGDSLWSIARRFKVSTQQLVAWNDISAKKPIKPGQKLRVASAG
ncbi:MAG: LysM peptidoglycan-binding domain-containing protein [Halioglobus sp.]|nr:LysM peptidoglycan-binding domain-containing protein [Halioglobus sp.]